MAICPFAVQQLIPETWTQGRITPTTLIYHRAVSSADSLQGFWNTPGVEVESHFYIGRTGTIYQFMDTNVRADANWYANGFAVSVETWDGGNTPDSMEWNDAQVTAAKRLGKWVTDTHAIPKRAATSWNGGGIGGHNWFAEEWAGGPRGCPGTARNAQLRNDIIPAIAAGNVDGGTEDMNKGQEDILFETHALMVRVVQALLEGKGPEKGNNQMARDLGYVLDEVDRRSSVRDERTISALEAIHQTLREISAKLPGGAAPGAPVEESKPARRTHTVHAGDTLYSLAQAYGTTVEALVAWNNLAVQVLSIGQTLYVEAPRS